MARAGKETILTAAGYGTRRVHATVIDHGMTIQATSDTARKHRVFYPWKRTSSSFEMTVHHPSMAEYRAFNEWMQGYVERVTNPDTVRLGPMRIICSAVRFDRLALPGSGITFGNTSAAFERQQTIRWIGASDPVNAASLGVISTAYEPTYREQGGQIGDYRSSFAIGSLYDAVASRGGRAFEDALYNPSVPESPLVASRPPTIPAPPSGGRAVR